AGGRGTAPGLGTCMRYIHVNLLAVVAGRPVRPTAGPAVGHGDGTCRPGRRHVALTALLSVAALALAVAPVSAAPAVAHTSSVSPADEKKVTSFGRVAVETGDRFGWSQASGDFNDDGCPDVAVPANAEDGGAAVDAGCVGSSTVGERAADRRRRHDLDQRRGRRHRPVQPLLPGRDPGHRRLQRRRDERPGDGRGGMDAAFVAYGS